MDTKEQICVIIGASQAGVTCAFALREEGWEGGITLIDADPILPYYKPPLSKTALVGTETIDELYLKPAILYEKEGIELHLGKKVSAINRKDKFISIDNGTTQFYDKLVLATGARPFIPEIPGLKDVDKVFSIRTIQDIEKIKNVLNQSTHKRVVIIGGGYIGLETAASLVKLGAKVSIIEREKRVLKRVAAPEISQFYTELHIQNGVDVVTEKNVVSIAASGDVYTVNCNDNKKFEADLIVVGVGVKVNLELAEKAGLITTNGICVDATAKTNDSNIYAIGDCTYHHNPFYDRYVRLESIQNASDQAKIAAQAICGNPQNYKALPWFWSDQYEAKLQVAGLFEGFTDTVVRNENGKLSVWYFKEEQLLAVDAVNDTKAYVIGTKFIKAGIKVDKAKLCDLKIDFKPGNLILKSTN